MSKRAGKVDCPRCNGEPRQPESRLCSACLRERRAREARRIRNAAARRAAEERRRAAAVLEPEPPSYKVAIIG